METEDDEGSEGLTCLRSVRPVSLHHISAVCLDDDSSGSHHFQHGHGSSSLHAIGAGLSSMCAFVTVLWKHKSHMMLALMNLLVMRGPHLKEA